MVDFTPFRSIENNIYKISIDTLRTSIYKATILNYLTKRGVEIQKVKSNSKISSNAKKLLFTKEVTSLFQVFLPRFKNTLLSTPNYLNMQSDYKKCNIVAFGLSQPNRPLHVEAKDALKELFDKFKVHSLDLAIDSPHPIDIKKLSLFGEVVQHFNTFYINKPLLFRHISKIKYYDKALQLKELYNTCIEPLYRLELTINVKGRLETLDVPNDEIEDIMSFLSNELIPSTCRAMLE